jgi:DNA polymerase I-like protein with 3'-5' exonuclease and polymerase domains
MIIKDQAGLDAALKFIEEADVLAYDVESTGLNVRKECVIGFGVSDNSFGCYIPILLWDRDSNALLPTGLNIDPILQALKTKKLITWNASFDMRITLNNLGVDLLPALHADVLLMKHTADEEYPFGLKEVGTKIFGASVTREKEEMQASIKENGGTAKQFFKADTEILGKYCIQDCLLTCKLFEHYSHSLSNQGLKEFYYSAEVLPLYKEVTIPMEAAGVQLDMEMLSQALVHINQDLVRLEDEVQAAIKPHLGLFTQWFLNKDYPMKTALGNLTKLGREANKHGFTDITRMQMGAWFKDYPNSYMFNLLSKHHLKKLFFDTLNEEPISRTPTGQPQVDEEFLATMVPKHPWVANLIEFNKLTKIKGTYIERFLEENENGRFYPSYKQHGTVSGRLSGDFQQLPRPVSGDSLHAKHASKIRAFITANPGCQLISADYAQLEPRCFASASGDRALRNIFVGGADFYSRIAQQTEGLKEVSKEQRQKAKAYALGIAYGMTGYKLKFEIDCDQETADRLVGDYLRAFPDLASWMEESKSTAYKVGHVTSLAGRRRRLGRAKALYNRYGSAILDDLQLWKQFHNNPVLYTQAKADRREFKNLCNNAINFQIQSLGASIINRAAIAISRRFKLEGMKSIIVGQVHDELIVNAPVNEVHVAKIIIQTCMENVYKIDVPLLANPISGHRYSDCK